MFDMCFWLAKTRKDLSFLRCIQVLDLVLKHCSFINEGNCMQQLFYLLVLMNVVGSLIGKSFFNLWVRFQNEVFSFFCVTERLLINSRSDLTTKWSILQFLKLKFASFCLLHICVELNLQELLECDCLSMILNLLDSYLEGYFGLFF